LNTQDFGLHLCQPDTLKSCAWCCGLYNRYDRSRTELARKLRARTEEFARTRRTVEGILSFSENNREKEEFRLVDPEFYSCEFVGFLNEEETLVGCMLHPLARGNGGTDWRGLSFHGGMACQGFFCRCYRELSPLQKQIILATVDDWFLYGLLMSDADFIHGFFRAVEQNLIDPVTLLMPVASKLVHEFFESLVPLDTIPVRLSSKFYSPSERKNAEEKMNTLCSLLRGVAQKLKHLAT
jgi:hypothetical protein